MQLRRRSKWQVKSFPMEHRQRHMKIIQITDLTVMYRKTLNLLLGIQVLLNEQKQILGLCLRHNHLTNLLNQKRLTE